MAGRNSGQGSMVSLREGNRAHIRIQLHSGATMQAVSLNEVEHVAELANLQLTEAELPRMQRDLNAILGYIATLNELDTADIVPMAQVGELLGSPEAADRTGAELRADAVRPSVERRAVMAEAPESDGRFFKVPKVIDR